MCDYSLMKHFESRLGKVGENVHLKTFPTGTKGFVATKPEAQTETAWRRFCRGIRAWFAAPRAATDCVVCFPHGAKLRLHGLTGHALTETGGNADPAVTFVQFGFRTNQHRDGLRFPNGAQLLLQELPEKLRATVISMGGEEDIAGTPAAITYQRPRVTELADDR